MKNAMKKLMSLLLVAVLMVSAIPFQASAYSMKEQTLEDGQIWVLFKTEDGAEVYETIDALSDDSTNGDNLVNYWLNKAGVGKYKIDASRNAESTAVNIQKSPRGDGTKIHSSTKTIVPGDYVTIVVEEDVPAAEINLTINEKFSGERIHTWHGDAKNGATTIGDLLKYKWDANWTDSYTTDADLDEVVNPGESVTVTVEALAIEINIKLGNSDAPVVFTDSKRPANGETSVAKNLLTHIWEKEWAKGTEISKVWSHLQGKYITADSSVKAGDVVTFILTTKDSAGNSNNNNTGNNNSGNNNGSNNNGSNNNGSNNNGNNEELEDGTLWLGYEDKVNKDPYAVKLRVYLKGHMSTLSSSHTITNSLAKDGLVTMSEVKEFIKTKYKAKDSDGIDYDGIYLWEGNWVGDWAYDTDRYDAIDNINVARKYKEINLVVVLDNATLRSSGTADTSNPKTGDSIGMVMTTMGLSAAALAVLFLNKKRAVQ